MASKKNGGLLMPNPFNETTGGGASENPNDSGAGLYADLNEVMAAHLSQGGADMEASANMRSGAGMASGPAPGEPNPAGYSGTSESK